LKKIPDLTFAPLLLILFISAASSANPKNPRELYSPSQTQTLHFTIKEIDLDEYRNAFLMNITPPDEGVMKETNQTNFVSPPLASIFTFSNITITVHHTLIPQEGYQLLIKVGLLTIQNQSMVSHFSYENLQIGTQVTSHSFATECCGITVLENQRFWLELQISSPDIKFFWGNLAYNSRVSYDGTASFIPEFSSSLILLLLIIISLIAIIVDRKKERSLLFPFMRFDY